MWGDLVVPRAHGRAFCRARLWSSQLPLCPIFWTGGRTGRHLLIAGQEDTFLLWPLSDVTQYALVTVVDIEVLVEWEEKIRLGGFRLFNMRRTFVSWLWKRKEHPALMHFFFFLIRGCFLPYKFSWNTSWLWLVMTHACPSAPAMWHYFSSDVLWVQEGLQLDLGSSVGGHHTRR